MIRKVLSYFCITFFIFSSKIFGECFWNFFNADCFCDYQTLIWYQNFINFNTQNSARGAESDPCQNQNFDVFCFRPAVFATRFFQNFWPLNDDLSCLGTYQKWLSQSCRNAIIPEIGPISVRNKNGCCAFCPIPLWLTIKFFSNFEFRLIQEFFKPKKPTKNSGWEKKFAIFYGWQFAVTQEHRQPCNAYDTTSRLMHFLLVVWKSCRFACIAVCALANHRELWIFFLNSNLNQQDCPTIFEPFNDNLSCLGT